MAVNQASVLTSHLKTHPSLLYRKVAEDQLDQATLMHMWGVPRPIEQGHSEIQLHRYSLGAENMVPQNEGQVGAGSQIGDSIFKMKPAYYGDFVIISDNVAIEVYSDYRKTLLLTSEPGHQRRLMLSIGISLMVASRIILLPRLASISPGTLLAKWEPCWLRGTSWAENQMGCMGPLFRPWHLMISCMIPRQVAFLT